MAIANSQAFLEELYAYVNNDVRTTLNKFATIVTMTDESLGQGFKEGYALMVAADKTKTDWPTPEESDWKTWGGVAVNVIYAHVIAPRTKVSLANVDIPYIKSQKIVYKGSRDFKGVYDKAKNSGIQSLNAWIRSQGGRSLRGLGEQRVSEKAAGISRDKDLYAGQTEVGLFKSALHRSHKGTTTVGAAQMAGAMRFIGRTKNMQGFIGSAAAKDLNEVFNDINIIYKTTGTKKGGVFISLNEDQQVGIELGPKSRNKVGSEATDWVRLKPRLEESVYKFVMNRDQVDRAGSKSIRDHAEEAAEYNIVKTLTARKNVTTKKNPKPKGRKPSNVTVKKNKKGVAPKGSKRKGKAIVSKKKTQVSTATNILSLAALINSKLPETVRKNMKAPGLVNRTGRFANSTKIVNALYTKQGYPSFGYTYQKDPYQVFEPASGGAAWSSQARDPKRLIDRSIREIAATILQGRFFTRRV